MFELIKAIVLGFVQGATEFIPVSSSAHLALVPWLMGWDAPGLFFDLVLHWGTLVAVFIVFWKDFLELIQAGVKSLFTRSLADPMARLAWFIVVGTIPAVVLGFFAKDFVEGLFANYLWVGIFLLVTAALLALAEQLTRRQSNASRTVTQLNWLYAIVVGCMQALALAPGISRSGSTIAAGLARGIRRDQAARFSFLLGTPAILGAGLLQLVDTLANDAAQVTGQAPMLLAGFLAAAVTGVLAIRFLLAYLRNHTLYVFSAYCLILGLITIVLSFVLA